jgi:predicted metalloprotease with PDZ domain
MGNIQCCSADSCAAKAKTATQCCFSENIETEVKADDQTVVDQVTVLKEVFFQDAPDENQDVPIEFCGEMLKSPAQPEEEKPPALWPEAEAVQGLVIEFDTGSGGSGVEKVTITKKPLGMTFDRRVPIKITKLSEGGSALEAGVKVGYLIRSINGKETDGRTFEECMEIMQEGVAKCTVVQSTPRQVS